jgi:hypothetical protein
LFNLLTFRVAKYRNVRTSEVLNSLFFYSKRWRRKIARGRSVFIGLDVHKESWQVSVRAEEEEICHGRLPSEYPALDRPIARLPRCTIKVAYEAGFCEF